MKIWWDKMLSQLVDNESFNAETAKIVKYLFTVYPEEQVGNENMIKLDNKYGRCFSCRFKIIKR